MSKTGLSRRSILKGAAAAAVLPGFTRGLLAATPPVHENSALVILYLNGGPSGLFNSANSFLPSGSFGVSGDNVRAVGNGVFVDASTLGSLPPAALANMASINFKHGIQRHELARGALLQTGSRSNLLLLAQAMSARGGGRCAVVNTLGLPVGVDPNPATEGGIGLERILDLKSLNAAGGLAEPAESRARIAAAYGLNAPGTNICDLKTTLVATELLVRSGTNVIFAQPAYMGRTDRQFDTHMATPRACRHGRLCRPSFLKSGPSWAAPSSSRAAMSWLLCSANSVGRLMLRITNPAERPPSLANTSELAQRGLKTPMVPRP
jgi:hypothetical protein